MADVGVLQGWAKSHKLSQATLSADGATLDLGGETVTANVKVTISHDGKSCEYTIGSIFLQAVDPTISLPKYRLACKKHKVSDPVKASDKPTVIGFFGLTPDEEGAVAAAPVPVKDDAAAQKPPPSSKPPPPPSDHRHDKKRPREKDRRHKSSKDKRSRHSTGSAEKSKPKKAPKQIDANALFTNLTTVVTKRSEKKEAEQSELYQALSPEGFEVTPDLLQENSEICQSIQANEIPVGNSASILKGSTEKDLSPVLKLYLDTMQPSKKMAAKQARIQDKAKRSWRPYLVGKKPVIILPKGMTSPLTMTNAHEFFGKSLFVPRDVMMKRGASARNAPTTFSRKLSQRLGGGMVEYELMDNPKSKLPTAKDWERVVAVVALGHGWQFKDWPGIYSNPVHLFAKTFGFYVGMEGAKIPQEIPQWSVVRQTLNRDKRGLDSVTYASFWNGLEEFMTIHKPEMLPQDE
ncbi:unnamed protein product [Cylindrotheca closterium]|uniref:Cell division control protein 73 C-terminal domain-containing protein n=1 Tax=Cylindrotheca closterium TaxID=2856 RepID=A0AAD2G0R4_9STRA|nr:unnamed protein product [Cylindrotheca closterium]